MKKLILITTLVASLSTSSAFAKTEGSYAGIDVLRAKANVKTTKVSDTNNDTYFDTNSSDSQTGFGVQYKYAINMNDFFIAPGFFYENLGLEAKNSDAVNQYEQSVKIQNRYGVKFDLGYDLMDNLAIYAPLGYSMVNYELKTNDYFDSSSLVTKTTGRKSAFFYGLGLSFAATDKVVVNLEYNRSSINLVSGGNVALIGNTTLKAKTNLDLIKLGVAYKF